MDSLWVRATVLVNPSTCGGNNFSAESGIFLEDGSQVLMCMHVSTMEISQAVSQWAKMPLPDSLLSSPAKINQAFQSSPREIQGAFISCISNYATTMQPTLLEKRC